MTTPLSGVGLPVNISITPANATLALGATLQLSAFLTDVMGAEQNPLYPFAWSTSNRSLASVDANGLVTAFQPNDLNVLNTGGTVTITATYPWANSVSGQTISAEAAIPVHATPAVSWSVPIAPGDDPSAGHTNQWKAVPQSLAG